MENEVWSEISAFLNNLRCGDVSRKSYLHFPELEEAENEYSGPKWATVRSKSTAIK